MPAPSLFCPHKRLVSVCPVCGSARAGAATPQRTAVKHDVDATIHAFRGACHARFRDYLGRVAAGEPAGAAYAAAYDPMTRRGRVASEEEDTSTFRGGFYRGLVKMFDVTIDDRRIQGYNGLADWEEMRDYVFRKLSPDDLAGALREKRLLVHGGNAAWPRQQIATELVRTDALQEAVLHVAFGADGVSCAQADARAVAERLARAERIAVDAGAKPGTVGLFSKVLHVMAPARWPALTPRWTPEVADELGVAHAEVRTGADYVAFADTMRALAKARGHADLAWTDMLVADTAASLGDEDEPLDEA